MTSDELYELQALLEKFEKCDCGNLTEFARGGWSRQNLDNLIRDVQEAKIARS